MFRKLLFVAMLIFSLQVTFTSHAQDVSISLANFQPGTPFCSNSYNPNIGRINVIITGSGTLNTVVVVPSYNGVSLGSATSSHNTALPTTITGQSISRAIVTNQSDLPSNTVVDFRVTVYTDNGSESTSFYLNCTTLAISYGGTSALNSGVEVAPDNRLNWRYGDSHIGILYPGYEGAIDLYDYETDIFIYDFFTEDDIPETPPVTNILIRSYGRTSVYILTTGQIQFNLGPDAEGKIWVFVMDDLYDRNNEDSYYIPPAQ